MTSQRPSSAAIRMGTKRRDDHDALGHHDSDGDETGGVALFGRHDRHSVQGRHGSVSQMKSRQGSGEDEERLAVEQHPKPAGLPTLLAVVIQAAGSLVVDRVARRSSAPR